MERYQQWIVCRYCIKTLAVSMFIFNLFSCHLFENNRERLPYYNSQDLTPTWDVDNIHQIAKFKLIDQRGKKFQSDSLIDKIYIANFFFTTCPGICPKMTRCFRVLQDSIVHLQEVELLSFSVMPWVDSWQKLKKYGEENHINVAKWHILTGDQSIIYSLGRSSFFADKNSSKDTSSFLHTDKMFLIDKQQHIRGVYNATKMDDVSRVLEDIKILKKEI